MTIAIILCAARKHNDAGYFRNRDGQPVRFVAQPDLAQPSKIYTYARPDDVADVGGTWRELLADYNKRNRDANPFSLLKAWQLYRHKTYGQLVRQLGEDNVYILSAGWGLLPANYLTPLYDITFSPLAEDYQRRNKEDLYKDMPSITNHGNEPMVYFGSKFYIPLFCKLTARHRGRRIVFYNSAYEPNAPGCELVRFNTKTRTVWYYECAQAFIDGRVTV